MAAPSVPRERPALPVLLRASRVPPGELSRVRAAALARPAQRAPTAPATAPSRAPCAAPEEAARPTAPAAPTVYRAPTRQRRASSAPPASRRSTSRARGAQAASRAPRGRAATPLARWSAARANRAKCLSRASAFPAPRGSSVNFPAPRSAASATWGGSLPRRALLRVWPAPPAPRPQRAAHGAVAGQRTPAVAFSAPAASFTRGGAGRWSVTVAHRALPRPAAMPPLILRASCAPLGASATQVPAPRALRAHTRPPPAHSAQAAPPGGSPTRTLRTASLRVSLAPRAPPRRWQGSSSATPVRQGRPRTASLELQCARFARPDGTAAWERRAARTAAWADFLRAVPSIAWCAPWAATQARAGARCANPAKRASTTQTPAPPCAPPAWTLRTRSPPNSSPARWVPRQKTPARSAPGCGAA